MDFEQAMRLLMNIPVIFPLMSAANVINDRSNKFHQMIHVF